MNKSTLKNKIHKFVITIQFVNTRKNNVNMSEMKGFIIIIEIPFTYPEYSLFLSKRLAELTQGSSENFFQTTSLFPKSSGSVTSQINRFPLSYPPCYQSKPESKL